MNKITNEDIKINDSLQKRKLIVNIGIIYVIISLLIFIVYYLTPIKDVEMILTGVILTVGIIMLIVYTRQTNIELREQGQPTKKEPSKYFPTFSKFLPSDDFSLLKNPSSKLTLMQNITLIISSYFILIVFDMEALKIFYHRVNNPEGLIQNNISNDPTFIMFVIFILAILAVFMIYTVTLVERVKLYSKSLSINDYFISYISASFLATHIFFNLPIYIDRGREGVFLPTMIVGLFVILTLTVISGVYNFVIETRDKNVKKNLN